MSSGIRLVAVAGLIVVLVAGAVYFLGTGAGGNQNTTTQTTTGRIVMSLGQTPRLLGPGITMNYTLTISPGSGVSGMANLSAEEPPGITVVFNPSRVSLSGGDVAVDVSVHADDSIAPSDYSVVFRVAWGTGSSNLTYQFRVVQHMVLLVGGFNQAGGFDPQTINVKVGDSVVWLSVDPGGDEFGGVRQVRIVELNATSPTLAQFSSWAFTFTQAGTYTIEDPLNHLAVPDSSVVVS